MSVYQYLKNFREISFHMPGHKGNIPLPVVDVTELSGTDNLMCPEGIIKEAQENMARELEKKAAFFLTNGASSGILSGILATTKENETVLVDRNCHVSVLNGLILSGAVPKFMYPKINQEFGIPYPLFGADIAYRSEKTVIVTSPTYYGEVSDMKKIRESVGDAVILQDESHGAHFYFSEELKALRTNEADLSVLSFHKTMPTMNQGAVLALNTEKVSKASIKNAINMVTTTSPSYPVLASLDYAGIYGKELYGDVSVLKEILTLKEVLKKNTPVRILENQDAYRLLLNFDFCLQSAKEIQRRLEQQFSIYAEGVFGNNLLLMFSPCNTVEEIKILEKAFLSLDLIVEEAKHQNVVPVLRLEQKLSPREAYFAQGEFLPKEKAVGRVSKENITRFPPCIPIVTIGEVLTEEALSLIEKDVIEVVK